MDICAFGPYLILTLWPESLMEYCKQFVTNCGPDHMRIVQFVSVMCYTCTYVGYLDSDFEPLRCLSASNQSLKLLLLDLVTQNMSARLGLLVSITMCDKLGMWYLSMIDANRGR